MLPLLVSSAAALELSGAEVARHDTAADCWLILDDTVYDVTQWVETHPGGDAIARGCGKDASWFFAHRDDQGGHSKAANAILPTYRLGRVGDTVPDERPEPPPTHAHDVRLQRTRLGISPTADVGPGKTIALRAGHQISTSADDPSGIGLQVGYSAGFLDVVISDEQAAGVGGIEVKVRPLDQHGDAAAPLSVGLVAGAGMGYVAEAPALWAQAALQRDLLDRRLLLRANGTAASSPGVEGSTGASTGAALEFRPIPLHGVFAELQIPFADPAAVVWTGGLSLYTRGHAFALYAASTPALHPAALAGPTAKAIAVGASFEKAFRL